MTFKRIMNFHKDKQYESVYKNSVNGLYMWLMRFRAFVQRITYSSLHEVEECTTMMDKIAAHIDIYTDNKFSRPSTIIGLRKGISIIGEGVTLFIDAVYKNGDSDLNQQQLLQQMIHAYDLLMAGSRMLIHAIETERQELIVGVDIIDKYYESQNRPKGDIKFTVQFTQPERILGRDIKEDKNGTNKRKRTSGNGL